MRAPAIALLLALTCSAFADPQLLVTNTNDSGEGSLRAAIEEANRLDCDAHRPCAIRFDFAPGPVPVIEPLSPLPAITACGASIGDPILFGVTPPVRVELRGTYVATGPGLEFRGDCRSDVRPLSTITNLAVGGFPGDGIAVNAVGSGHRIRGCVIGSDATGMRAIPNGLRGIAVTAEDAFTSIEACQLSGNARSGFVAWMAGTTIITGSRIGIASDGSPLRNGASGIFLAPDGGQLQVSGTTIANHPHFGIALATRNAVSIADDVRITANETLDLDWNLDGPTVDGEAAKRIPNTPRIVDAHYDEARNVTDVTFGVDPLPGAKIDDVSLRLLVFASTATTRFGTAHMDTLVAAVPLASRGTPSRTVTIEGDLRGKYLSGLLEVWTLQAPYPDTPPPGMLNVSEVSQAVRVQ